jgi:SAM-dependent methyltransferase
MAAGKEQPVTDGDYVLGTEDEEIERLGLQHRVWRPRMLEGFRRAGIAVGETVIDVGCGPGWASVDLAEMVGATGRVVAFERSRRFLASLAARAAAAGLANIEAHERDVAQESLGEGVADRAWCRWVLSFVENPRRTTAAIAAALRPGGTVLFHEYADYGAWQAMPPLPDLDRFRALVMQSWRDSGGEPDIALHLPALLAGAGLEVLEVRPLIEIVGRGDPLWAWPQAFMAVNARRLEELGHASAEEAERFATALARAPAATLMITPLVAEVIARKPR